MPKTLNSTNWKVDSRSIQLSYTLYQHRLIRIWSQYHEDMLLLDIDGYSMCVYVRFLLYLCVMLSRYRFYVDSTHVIIVTILHSIITSQYTCTSH